MPPLVELNARLNSPVNRLVVVNVRNDEPLIDVDYGPVDLNLKYAGQQKVTRWRDSLRPQHPGLSDFRERD